jgi:hypothetical protein
MGNHLASDPIEAALFEASRICALTTLPRLIPDPPCRVESSSTQYFDASITATPLLDQRSPNAHGYRPASLNVSRR